MRRLPVVKAHAYGNDFLLLDIRHAEGDRAALARALCDRHQGVGADGLICYSFDAPRVTMHLLNADGSFSELSGNGLRCLAALAASRRALAAGALTLGGWWFDIATGEVHVHDKANGRFVVVDRESLDRLARS